VHVSRFGGRGNCHGVGRTARGGADTGRSAGTRERRETLHYPSPAARAERAPPKPPSGRGVAHFEWVLRRGVATGERARPAGGWDLDVDLRSGDLCQRRGGGVSALGVASCVERHGVGGWHSAADQVERGG